MIDERPPIQDQSLADLLRRIVDNLNTLVERQIELVKQELREHLSTAFGASKTLAIGIGVAVVGVLALLNVLTLALVLGLNEIGGATVPYVGQWLGWLVAIVLLVVAFWVAYRLVVRGIREAKFAPVAKTRRTLGEDVEWAQRLLTRNAK